MNVCVIGYGHFASIVAVVLASRGHVVVQSDETPYLMRANQITPDAEPGYSDLAQRMRSAGSLVGGLPSSPHVYWIAYDVPLNTNGAPDISEIERRIVTLDDQAAKGIPFLVSCQWPVGTTAKLEAQCHGRRFVYVLENVRAGKALADFDTQPSIIVGARQPLAAAPAVETLLRSLCPELIVMSPESGELSKHALNAFIALQIAFVNEITDVAKKVDANPADVSRSLLSDPRVSPKAPLRAGAPFGGGSLHRDLLVLEGLSDGPILHAIRASNDSR